jgi:hypothetical protein
MRRGIDGSLRVGEVCLTTEASGHRRTSDGQARSDRLTRYLIGVDQLANFGGAVATLVLEKRGVLEAQRQQLLNERQAIEQRRAVRQHARDHIKELQSWCSTVASRLVHDQATLLEMLR